MEKMINATIELNRPSTALKMKWVELAYEQTNDEDAAFTELFKLQKGDLL